MQIKFLLFIFIISFAFSLCFTNIKNNKDADKAIEIDKDYIKAYYRRASANLILNHYHEAIKDLEFIQLKYPNEESLKDKISKAKAERKKKKFLESLASDRPDGT